MNDFPIDTRHPAVRDYLALIRLQVLTPLSLLINMAATMVCAFIAEPSLRQVSKMYPTSITPQSSLVAAYVIAIYLGQIGYCVLLVLARKPETKATLVKGVGLSLVFANWVMAGWAIAWTLKFFWVATVFLSILVLLLLYANIVLLIYHVPTSSRPFDIALIHAPLRLFLILPLTLTLPHTIFVAVGHHWLPGTPQNYDEYMWEGFGVVLGANLLALLVVVTRRDLVWCVGAVWVCVSIWSSRPKSAPVYITTILFTVALPIALVLTYVWSWLHRNDDEGAIALPADEEEGVVDVRR